jgi:hypothetical protein
MIDNSSASRAASSRGKSLSRKNGPREVPPRMNRQGMDRCIGAARISGYQ